MQPIVLINAFEVPADSDDDFVRGWEAARDYLETQPGYIDAALHRTVSPDADFRFVNVAHWESAETFQVAIQSPGFREASRLLSGYGHHPALDQIVST
jgi:heme-degrading monooxygenase HmoA